MQNQSFEKIDESLYRDYFSHLLIGDYQYNFYIVNSLIKANVEIKDLYINLFQRSLYEVGTLWEHNRISVTVEHIATSITESLMTLVYPIIFASEKIGKSAVVASIVNEFHQIGGKMVADIFEINGWDGYFLAANKSYNDLVSLIDSKEPCIVGLSLSISFNFKNLIDIAERLIRQYPSLKIIVGGQGFKYIPLEVLQPYNQNLEYIDTLFGLEKVIKDFN